MGWKTRFQFESLDPSGTVTAQYGTKEDIIYINTPACSLWSLGWGPLQFQNFGFNSSPGRGNFLENSIRVRKE